MSTVFDKDSARQAVRHFYSTHRVTNEMRPAYNQKGVWAKIPEWVYVAHEEAPGAQTSKRYWDNIKKLESSKLEPKQIASGTLGTLWTSYVLQASDPGAVAKEIGSIKFSEIKGHIIAAKNDRERIREQLEKMRNLRKELLERDENSIEL
jgi:hypothetical protein